MENKYKIKVNVWESERGWGRRLDEVKLFNTKEEAMKWVAEFNSHNTSDTVPDWYMFAEYVG